MVLKGVILPITLVLLLCTSIVEGGIFLKVKDPLIVQEAVWIYSNSTAISQVALDVPANKFIKTIAPLNNVPDAAMDGTTGVLYNRQDSCSPQAIPPPPTTPFPFYAPSPKLSKVPKIAFIKKQGGNCTLTEKILNAQSEGAIGVIVYDIMTNLTAEQDFKAGILPESGITIPAYFADYGVGVNLLYQLEKMAGVPVHTIPTYDGVNLTTRISVRISLMPSDNIKPCAWELTLLVMLVLLGACVFFSVLMHFYLWKKNQRLQSVVERHRTGAAVANTLPMGKALITMTRLYQFPTRIIDTLPDEEERKKVETVLSDEKQREQLIKTTALSSSHGTVKKQNIFMRKKKFKPSTTTPSTTDSVIDAPPINNMCVICLEAFKIGNEVRELPCHHEFHSGTCIDPWLTSKSGECPLCKFDCSSPSEEIQAEYGISGMWLRFIKAVDRKKTRIGQVIPGDIEQQRYSRQSTIVALQQEASPSPALRAMEAIEAAVEELPCLGQQITTVAAAEAAIAAAAAAEEEVSDHQVIEEHQQEEEKTYHHVANKLDAHQQTVMDDEEEEDEEEALSIRCSTTTNQSEFSTTATYSLVTHSGSTITRPIPHDATIQSIVSNTSSYYVARPSSITNNNSNNVTTTSGGPLPDIDVSAISLCSIDLGGGLVEEFQNTFKK